MNISIKKKKDKLKNLKASILIANYNNDKYIKDCISSLLNQTYKNIEIIFHDDCSNDRSLIKIKNYKNIKVIKNKKRTSKGSFNQIKAYQRAFKKSSGDIILFLDSDDFYKVNKIKKIIKTFKKNKNISTVFDLPIFYNQKKIINKKIKNSILENYWPYIAPQSCISMRRKEFKKILKKINFNLFSDIWMDFRIALYTKQISKNSMIINENLTYYRQTPEMASSKFKFLSIPWWKRRKQAHEYVKYFFKKNNILYQKNLDYFLTFIVNLLIK